MSQRKEPSTPSRRQALSRVGALAGMGALVLSALSAVPATAATTQLLTNGTFENGIAGWSAPFGGTLAASSDAHTGTGALQISARTGFQSGPAATVTGQLTTDRSYDLSIAVKYTGQPATQNVNVTLCTTSRSTCDVVVGGQAVSGEWLTLTKTFTPAVDTYDYLFIETPWNTAVASFVVDDASLTVQSTTPTTPTVPEVPLVAGNLLPDGRFVDGFTGWQSPRGGTLSLTADAASGANALKVTGRANSQSGPFASVTGKLEAGAGYRLTAKLKYTEGADTQRFNFTFCPANFNGCDDRGQDFTKGQWGSFSAEFVADQRHPGMDWLFVETPWGSNALQDFQVDELSLVKISDAPAGPGFTSLEKVQTKPIGDHNPLVGHKFGADPHHLVYNGRLYIYSTNDTQQYEANSKDANGLPTQSNGYGAITTLNVMSTTDMVNWVDHGSVPVAGAGAAAPWSRNSWAPAAIEKDGKVYLYFCDNGTGTAVVVGGSPLGPWTDPLGKKIIPDTVSRDYINGGGFPAGMWLFDPEVFIDDDGQGYLYFGGNSQIGSGSNVQGPQNPKSTRVVKLKDDMVTLDGDPVEIDGPGMFEASSIFKRDGKYYYSYSSNFQVRPQDGLYPPTGAIAYMMTDDPMNLPASTYAGVAFQNQSTFFGAGNGGNNHSDMFTYKGETYFTYHAQTRGAAWAQALGTPGQTQGYRSVHIDKLEFNADGTIKPVVGTRKGVSQIEDFDPYRTFEAETLAWQLGVKTTPTTQPSVEFPEHNGNGNMALSSLDDGDFAALSSVAFGDGATSVSARVKPLVEGASVQVRLDDVDGPVVATLPVSGTPGEWTTVTAAVDGATGTHDVFFVFAQPESTDAAVTGPLFEVDNWTFTAAQSPVENDPSIALSATEVRAGGTLTVTGTDFTAPRVEVGVASTYRALADADVVDGAFSTVVTIPSDLEPGAHTIRVQVDGEVVASAPITVLAADGAGAGSGTATPTPVPAAGGSNLAATGGSPGGVVSGVLAGLLLLLAGAAVVWRRRRLS
ncbi:family 43 glycosylhydrolase [Microbacterium sp.]|uniref:family 43 glycosylhydrolase n=1 Tax=Microbacterium sp. TaxID=51671 RepID=UPI0025F455C2|nr:family 43 glycosylhydrolase [Microbacterium sp.]